MHYIPANIKQLRKRKGWTQTEFARQLGVKRSLIAAYEEGRADPRISFLQMLCEKFALTLDELIDKKLDSTRLESPVDVKGKSLRILPIAVHTKDDSEMATTTRRESFLLVVVLHVGR